MWKLGYWNNALDKWYEMGECATEQNARDILQIWIDDEYYTRNIEDFQEYELEDNITIIIIDGEIFGIGRIKI